MEKIMEGIFRGGIMPEELCCPKKKEYVENMHLLTKLEDKMKKQMTQELAGMLDVYKEHLSILSEMENEECFKQGMSLGIRLTAEAFLLGKDKNE